MFEQKDKEGKKIPEKIFWIKESEWRLTVVVKDMNWRPFTQDQVLRIRLLIEAKCVILEVLEAGRNW